MAASHTSPRILIRADARPDLGGGHIMRCLSLAQALTARGADIAFASAPGSATLVPALERAGYPVNDTSEPAHAPLPDAWGGAADAVFVDLYDSTDADETALRQVAPVIGVIEDLPERTHDCDVLVDQGFDHAPAAYARRVPSHCRMLLGPDMVPLRPEFAAARADTLLRRSRMNRVERMLVAMGLTDVRGISERVTRAARAALPDARIQVVLGPTAQSREALERQARSDDRLDILIDVDDMHRVMADADLAIGAGGGTALERCVLGLPSLVIILADNQRESAKALDDRGAAWTLEDGPDVEEQTRCRLETLTPDDLKAAAHAAAAICDGQGADRIADMLLRCIAEARASRRHAGG